MAEKLVTIANFIYGPDPVSQAEITRMKLEDEGIDCFLAGKNFIAMYWLCSAIDRGVKLQVRQSDAEKAIEIIRSLEEKRTEQKTPEPDADASTCPKCGSENFEYEKFSRNLFYLGILFFRFPLPYPTESNKCNNCRHKWK
ncbi:MAG: DUF2007 domain-containing protein [Sedimentisphaerales bacterium]|nr:DUF2007 domain-containing protein [Sedimentisphaerales bacterium]